MEDAEQTEWQSDEAKLKREEESRQADASGRRGTRSSNDTPNFDRVLEAFSVEEVAGMIKEARMIQVVQKALRRIAKKHRPPGGTT